MQVSDSVARGRQLDEIAEALPQSTSALLRLFLSRTNLPVSRTEAAVLQALLPRPTRITELARQEGVTQPAITLVVNRLQKRGWVTREADPGDGRVVLVAITSDGRQVMAGVRARYRALVHEEMASLDDEEVETLAQAIEILDRLIERLKEREP
ncbi:MAG: MarR family transcriptional regulator [Solirubrobacterales bacterium]|nr:MarR family transcriptional regulator [Solirubrobacterales bacterium]MBV9715149.1 MarR family transcriptional regulator [Solirubrobacterales bacterium]